MFFTGATGGLGLLCVTALAATDRWQVFACGTNEAKLVDLGKLKNVIPVRVDITSQTSVLAARDLVLCQTDKLDAIVNFAGLTSFNSMVEGDSIEITERLLAVNLTGTVRVNHILFDLVHAARGRIINCSSEAGWMKPQPFAGPYFISKRALEAYNDSLRREVMYLGVKVIKIQPGSFDAGMPASVFEKFEYTLLHTRYYKKLLTRMKPLLSWELNQKQDSARLVRVVVKALESRRPRPNYRVGTGYLLALINLLPDSWLDRLYQVLFGRG
ncbi:MAG TPA: SDR family NAD(P)-dependent oxidoreductase [Dehalococcoidales bacterium]|nr:SDR family NAD(P)-dependent oxidoreductase [Dehalococcoidales bacterium]